MSGFAEGFAYVFHEEGGLADSAHDRGGRTNYGITTATWEAHRDQLGKPGTPVDACTPEDARYIYHNSYWLACKCDAFPWPLSLFVFDSAVQHGPKYAVVLLQRALGVPEDGVVGPKTIWAASVAPLPPLLRAALRKRLDYYRKILSADPGQLPNAAGWIRRWSDLWERLIRDLPEAA